jgi:hypothetical protein
MDEMNRKIRFFIQILSKVDFSVENLTFASAKVQDFEFHAAFSPFVVQRISGAKFKILKFYQRKLGFLPSNLL